MYIGRITSKAIKNSHIEIYNGAYEYTSNQKIKHAMYRLDLNGNIFIRTCQATKGKKLKNMIARRLAVGRWNAARRCVPIGHTEGFLNREMRQIIPFLRLTYLQILKALDKLNAGVVLTLDECRLSNGEVKHLESRLGEQLPEPRMRVLLDKPLSVQQAHLIQEVPRVSQRL